MRKHKKPYFLAPEFFAKRLNDSIWFKNRKTKFKPTKTKVNGQTIWAFDIEKDAEECAINREKHDTKKKV